jgi:hypothetical protein
VGGDSGYHPRPRRLLVQAWRSGQTLQAEPNRARPPIPGGSQDRGGGPRRAGHRQGLEIDEELWETFLYTLKAGLRAVACGGRSRPGKDPTVAVEPAHAAASW